MRQALGLVGKRMVGQRLGWSRVRLGILGGGLFGVSGALCLLEGDAGAMARRALFGTSSCSPASSSSSSTASSSSSLSPPPRSELPCYTMAEVRQHNRPNDAWLVMDGLVYDVTQWQHSHPGGHYILLSHAGKDVTREFNSLSHSPYARLLRSGLLGNPPPYPPLRSRFNSHRSL